MPKLFFVFDVESVGLHGQGFYVGVVVIEESGHVLDCFSCGCLSDDALGSSFESREWVSKNVPPLPSSPLSGPRAVRDLFWKYWTHWKEKGAVMAADCAWPVEARFLLECVDDELKAREWSGPYPLIDIGSVLLAAGVDPLKKFHRLPEELPEHNPLADARQSARVLTTALRDINDWENAAARVENP